VSNHAGELLSAYLDGELTSGEQAKVIAHLEQCPDCRTELADLHLARSMVRSLPVLEVPAWVVGHPGREAKVVPLRRRPAAWAAAAAATIVLLIGIATFVTPPPSVELNFIEVANTHRLPASQDGLPTVARAVLIAPTPGAAQ
jgi:anti-sigma factor RsiW